MLVAALPPDSALNRSRPELGGGWTVTDHLLAAAVDRLGSTAYASLVGPHADPKRLRKMKPPDPIPRPGHEPRRKRRQATSEDLKRMFGSAAAYRPKELNP